MAKRAPKILALDDDKSWLSQIPLILEDDCEVVTLSEIDHGIEALKNTFFDAILLDMNFENDARSGIDVFRLIKAKDHSADVIVISGETRPERLVQIMNAGVTKFLPKPCTPDQVRAAIRQVIDAKELRMRAMNVAQSDHPGSHLIGRSIQMQKLREEIDYVVKAGIKDILLTGETGTGKEVVAKTIAYLSDPNFRFMPIHCAAISDGLAESELFGHVKGAFTGADRERPSIFETAGGGFVFLDEIGDMPLAQQAKILRVIEERQVHRVGSSEAREVNFRSISATHINLEVAIDKKEFRRDLYYRIAKAIIKIPALRERREDIIDLVHSFLASIVANRKLTITEDALELLMAYHWPGNVRQLKAVIESVGLRNTDGVIREGDICQAVPQIASVFGNKASKALMGRYGASLISKERDRFEKAILVSRGNKKKAADHLGMSRATFYRRATELGLIQNRTVEEN